VTWEVDVSALLIWRSFLLTDVAGPFAIGLGISFSFLFHIISCWLAIPQASGGLKL
jgi:hypothetical protein